MSALSLGCGRIQPDSTNTKDGSEMHYAGLWLAHEQGLQAYRGSSIFVMLLSLLLPMHLDKRPHEYTCPPIDLGAGFSVASETDFNQRHLVDAQKSFLEFAWEIISSYLEMCLGSYWSIPSNGCSIGYSLVFTQYLLSSNYINDHRLIQIQNWVSHYLVITMY